jgi:hypothetical protein
LRDRQKVRDYLKILEKIVKHDYWLTIKQSTMDETKECEIEENRIAERNSSCILNDAARPLIYSKQRIF